MKIATIHFADNAWFLQRKIAKTRKQEVVSMPGGVQIPASQLPPGIAPPSSSVSEVESKVHENLTSTFTDKAEVLVALGAALEKAGQIESPESGGVSGFIVQGACDFHECKVKVEIFRLSEGYMLKHTTPIKVDVEDDEPEDGEWREESARKRFPGWVKQAFAQIAPTFGRGGSTQVLGFKSESEVVDYVSSTLGN